MRNIARVRRDRAIEVEMRTFHGIRPSIVRNLPPGRGGLP
jgi:hypothetical protein